MLVLPLLLLLLLLLMVLLLLLLPLLVQLFAMWLLLLCVPPTHSCQHAPPASMTCMLHMPASIAHTCLASLTHTCHAR